MNCQGASWPSSQVIGNRAPGTRTASRPGGVPAADDSARRKRKRRRGARASPSRFMSTCTGRWQPGRAGWRRPGYRRMGDRLRQQNGHARTISVPALAVQPSWRKPRHAAQRVRAKAARRIILLRRHTRPALERRPFGAEVLGAQRAARELPPPARRQAAGRQAGRQAGSGPTIVNSDRAGRRIAGCKRSGHQARAPVRSVQSQLTGIDRQRRAAIAAGEVEPAGEKRRRKTARGAVLDAARGWRWSARAQHLSRVSASSQSCAADEQRLRRSRLAGRGRVESRRWRRRTW